MWILERFANITGCQRRRAPSCESQIIQDFLILHETKCRLENIDDDCKFNFNKTDFKRDNKGVQDKATQTSSETVLLYASELKIHYTECKSGTSRATRDPVRVPRYFADEMNLDVCKFCERSARRQR